MKKPIPFSKQCQKCFQDGTQEVKECCPNCGLFLSMCKKYGGQCRSDKCRAERLGENSEQT